MQRTITWERSTRFGSLSSPSLDNVFQDFTDKNKQSVACFYLAILSGAPIKKNPRKCGDFYAQFSLMRYFEGIIPSF